MQCSKLSCKSKTASFLIKKKKAELTGLQCCSPNSFLSSDPFFPPRDCPTWVESKSINFNILGCPGVRISCSWGQVPISHRLHQLFLPSFPNPPGFPRSCPVPPCHPQILCQARAATPQGWVGIRVLSRAQQNVLRWAFPFGCPAEPIYFPFGEVLCKGCRSNLRLLRLSLCVLLERGSIDLCKQRGNELRDAPLTALPLFPGYPPAVFVSILSNLGVLVFNLQMEKVNGTTGSVPEELMLLPGRFFPSVIDWLNQSSVCVWVPGEVCCDPGPLCLHLFDGQLLKMFPWNGNFLPFHCKDCTASLELKEQGKKTQKTPNPKKLWLAFLEGFPSVGFHWLANRPGINSSFWVPNITVNRNTCKDSQAEQRADELKMGCDQEIQIGAQPRDCTHGYNWNPVH